MRFQEFEVAARDAFRRIPAEFRSGIDSLRVEEKEQPHPTREDVYTLGECVTEAYPSDWEGPDTTRSVVILYHGSFRRLSELDPDFDWDEELWETLTHEIRHHLEWLAAEDGLEGVDYAMDEEFKRWEGEPFDPWYFQHGDPVDDGVYRVEGRFYLEQIWTPEAFASADRIDVTWRGRRLEVERPSELGDVHFVRLLERESAGSGGRNLQAGRREGSERAPEGEPEREPERMEEVELVLLRKVGWRESLGRLFGRGATRVLESEAEAVQAAGG